MRFLEDLPLRFRVEVDHKVTAEDQVEWFAD